MKLLRYLSLLGLSITAFAQNSYRISALNGNQFVFANVDSNGNMLTAAGTATPVAVDGYVPTVAISALNTVTGRFEFLHIDSNGNLLVSGGGGGGGGVPSVNGVTGAVSISGVGVTTDTNTGIVTIASPAQATTQYIGPQPTAGCGVDWSGVGLVYTVGKCAYTINGQSYTTSSTNKTLAPADATNPRIDVFYVDTNQLVGVVTGSPAVTPQQPTLDPSTQLYLTFALVNANATTPANTTRATVYQEGTEWTGATGGTNASRVNLTSTNNPYAGTKDVEFGNGGTVTTTTYAQFTKPAAGTVDLASYNSFIFYIRNKAAWSSNRSVTIQWYNGSTAKGTAVVLSSGAFGFDATTNVASYQQISIPTALFGVNGVPVTTPRFTVSGSGGALTGFYLDEISLQSGNAGAVLPATLLNFKGTWSSTATYNPSDTVVSGGIGYVALVVNANQAVTNTAVWASLGTAGGTNCGALGDTSSTNCGFNNRVGDTGTVPQWATSFGVNLLLNNSAREVVAIGDRSVDGNLSQWDVIGIGDNSVSNIGAGSSEIIGIGDSSTQNLAADSFACIGIGTSSLAASILGPVMSCSDVVAIGDDALRINNGPATTLGDTVAIGHSAGKNLSGTHDNVIAIGDNAGAQPTPSPAHDFSDVVAIGDFSVYNNAGTSDVIGIGDTSVLNIGAGSTNIIGIGDNSTQNIDANSDNCIGMGLSSLRTNNGTSALFCKSVVAIGNQALNLETNSHNPGIIDVIVIGKQADISIDAVAQTDVIAIGTLAGSGLAGSVDNIVAIGASAGGNYGDGSTAIVAIGEGAGTVSASGIASSLGDIVVIGDGAGRNINGFHYDVVAIGTNAGAQSLPSTHNFSDVVAIGERAGKDSYGSDVVAIGTSPLSTGNSGNEIVAIGTNALVSNTTGYDNVAIGTNAGARTDLGFPNTTGWQNTWIGNYAGPVVATQLHNTIALGYDAENTLSNQVVIGSATIDNIKIGNFLLLASNQGTIGSNTTTEITLYGIWHPGIIYSAGGAVLPSCVAGIKGSLAIVSDATAPTYNGTYTSGGAITVPIICDGTNWLTH